MNVKEVTDLVLSLNGGKRIEPTCDQLIEGDWNSQVTGVATTFMATVDVIRQAIKECCNFIITHEPTYFTGPDRLDWLKDDEVYQAKKEFINKNKVSIWRFHDHMHMGPGDLIYDGLLEHMGWTAYLNKNIPQPHCYTIPPTDVAGLVKFLKKNLGMNTIQIVGRKKTKCSRVGILVGGGSLGLGHEEMPAKLMRDENLDAIICGEITEWTLAAYVRDAAQLGFNKALIIVGHERSEGPGMEGLVNRIRPLLKDIPVKYIEAGEPFSYL